ncbi:LysM peptidoglycan-binding domain-containing protein [Candidatus Saccharibacteria bacterium]|nr:LysM peptidoglycan-binding domain-containing protein [Candidatus Saccharibacteria bacterium]
MMAKKRLTKHLFLQIFTYLAVSAVVFLLIFFGSLEKRNATSVLNLKKSSYEDVSVDEISELYLAATVAESARLDSAPTINTDYYSAISQYNINQTSSSPSKIEKPTITDTSSYSRGVVPHVVAEGETLDSIIANSGVAGLTSDQVRWSNNMKNSNVSVGQTLYLPSVAGIVYTVKDGDTVDSLASKYGSDASSIVTYNDLETDQTLEKGQRIIIASGVLPETERPEYVPPAPTPRYNYYVSYSSGNPYPRGQCTFWSWQWRNDNMGPQYAIPSNLGNARYWDDNTRGSYVVDKNPSYGAVFVDEGGWYGHVGIVTSVNADGSIDTSEMNVYVAGCGWNIVCSRHFEQSTWSAWSFIHQKQGTDP